MNHFMRAHGYLPGPTQRPVLAGVVTGAAASVVALSLAWYLGALAAVAKNTGVRPAIAASVFTSITLFGGALYGRIFMRAANDREGGWLFGIGFGFLLWMLGPGTVAYWLWHAPLVTGRASQAFFASHLVFGLFLGVAFPHVHTLIERRPARVRRAFSRKWLESPKRPCANARDS
jgi:hypothetical protein